MIVLNVWQFKKKTSTNSISLLLFSKQTMYTFFKTDHVYIFMHIMSPEIVYIWIIITGEKWIKDFQRDRGNHYNSTGSRQETACGDWGQGWLWILLQSPGSGQVNNFLFNLLYVILVIKHMLIMTFITFILSCLIHILNLILPKDIFIHWWMNLTFFTTNLYLL